MAVAEFPPELEARPQIRLRLPAITLEQVLYVALFVLALGLRLWGLGDRAIHHDEAHHANFSWQLYQGHGYVHDPLLHGPFLYHLGALIFFLFGDTNFTARLGVALFGSVLTLMPGLLRRELGRGAALLAVLYLAVSPTVLYVNRFIRHDTYVVTFELLTIIALVRYAQTRRPAWLITVGAALALMFTNMATFFLFVAIFAPLLIGVLLWRVWKPALLIAGGAGAALVAAVFVLPGKPITNAPPSSGDSRAFLYWLAFVIALAALGPYVVLSLRRRAFTLQLAGAALAVVLLGTVALLPHAPVVRSGGTVQRENGQYVCPGAGNYNPPPNPIKATGGPIFGFAPLPTEDNDYAVCVRNQYDSDFQAYLAKLPPFFFHPAILLGSGVALAATLLLVYLLGYRKDSEGLTRWRRARESGDGILATYASLSVGWRWLSALAVFFAIYALFYTAFFTNPTGVISGTTGTLLYWLAQHDVRRGNQPDYYYIVTMGIYEPLVLLWGLCGLVGVGTLVARRLLNERPAAQVAEIDWELAVPVLIAWWAVGTFAIYSWAGEKMPWLTIRPTVPLTILGAWGLWQLIQRWRSAAADEVGALPGKPNDRSALWLYFGGWAIVLTLCYVIMASLLRPGTPNPLVGLLPALCVALLLLLTLAAWVLRGPRWALGAAALALTGSLFIGAVRNSYQLNYRWGDVPREMLIYTQTSPDVERLVNQLRAAATRRSGEPFPIWYDSETVWSWYMRRFADGKQQLPGASNIPGPEVRAVLVMDENYTAAQNAGALDGFVVQRLPLRWWFPEDQMYRLPVDWRSAAVQDTSPLLMRVLREPLDARTATQFWNYMLYRQLPAPLGSSDFYVAVRPDLAEELGLGFGQK